MQFKDVVSCFVSVILTLLLTTNTFSVEAAASAPPPALHIVIVEGQGAVNNIRQRTAREPVVEIRDENDMPVEGTSEGLPGVVRNWPNFSSAADEANLARIWGGIHFRTSVRDARIAGDAIGAFVMENVAQPAHGERVGQLGK